MPVGRKAKILRRAFWRTLRVKLDGIPDPRIDGGSQFRGVRVAQSQYAEPVFPDPGARRSELLGGHHKRHLRAVGDPNLILHFIVAIDDDHRVHEVHIIIVGQFEIRQAVDIHPGDGRESVFQGSQQVTQTVMYEIRLQKFLLYPKTV